MSEIYNLVYHGNGGFDYNSVYNMPIITRRFYIKKINEYNQRQSEKQQKAEEELKQKMKANRSVPRRKN